MRNAWVVYLQAVCVGQQEFFIVKIQQKSFFTENPCSMRFKESINEESGAALMVLGPWKRPPSDIVSQGAVVRTATESSALTRKKG